MTANSSRRPTHPGAPALIQHNSSKYLIVNKPTPATMPQFIKEMKKHNVSVVVRCCDPTYSTDPLVQEGISVVDCAFDDGAAPPAAIIGKWLDLVHETFKEEETSGNCIAVHCVAGLGRAPVLVAIALVEQGMKYHDAVEYIRQERRGAINAKQLEFLGRYKPINKHTSCTVM